MTTVTLPLVDEYLRRKARLRLSRWKDVRFVVTSNPPGVELRINDNGYRLVSSTEWIMDGRIVAFIDEMIEKARTDNPWVGMEWE